jgi:hypothetical protein
MAYDFTDEAGVALPEALTVIKTLRNITFSVGPSRQGQDANTLSVLSQKVVAQV